MKYRINSKYVWGCGTYYALQIKYKYIPYWFTISDYFSLLNKAVENAKLKGISEKELNVN